MIVAQLGGLYPGDRVVVGVIAAIGIPIVLTAGLLLLWRGYSLKRGSLDSLRSASGGDQVRLEGEAERIDGRTATAPVSGEECLACQVEAYRGQREPSGIEGGDTKKVATTRDGVPFVISTDDGDVLLADGEAFDLLFTDDRDVVNVSPNERRPERLDEWIRSDDSFDPNNGLIPSTMHYVENRLVPGETVFVEGVLDNQLPDGSALPRGVDAAITGVESRWFHRLFPNGPSLLTDMPHSETSRHILGRGGELLGASVFATCLVVVLVLRPPDSIAFPLFLVGIVAMIATVVHALVRILGKKGLSNLGGLAGSQ